MIRKYDMVGFNRLNKYICDKMGIGAREIPDGFAQRVFLFAERLIRKPKREGGCWEYPSSADRYSPVRFVLSPGVGKTFKAHVLFYVLFKERPEKNVCHKCDNTFCCKPSHLFEGDQAANMRDCAYKNRANKPSGEMHPRCVISKHGVGKILMLKNKGMYPTAIARKLGLGISGVRHVWTGRTRKMD